MLAKFLVATVEFLLGYQIIEFDKQKSQVQKGLATGLQCSVIFANIYLDALDILADRFRTKDVVETSSAVLVWARFIDDGFTIVQKSATESLHSFLSHWHASLEWEISARGLDVPYLDMCVRLNEDSGTLSFETYRKESENNEHLYIPRTSCHHAGAFTAIVIAETRRIFRTSRGNADNVQNHLQFFMDKLKARGYNRRDAEHLAHHTLSKLKKGASHSRLSRSKAQQSFYFRQEYSSSLNIKTVKHAIKRNWHVVETALRGKPSVSLSFRVQPNRFRRNFAINWFY